MADHLSILDTLRGKNLLVTGATGMIGKALVEKVLRSIPEVGSLYLLVRVSGKRSAAERIKEELLTSKIFDRLRSERTDFEDYAASKLVPIEGDLLHENAVIPEEHQATLAKSVDFVVHCAASTSFEAPLDVALEANAHGTMRLFNLTKSWGIKAFIHVSTCYVNAFGPGLSKEKVYPLPFDLDALLEKVSSLTEDDKKDKALMLELQHGYQSTYLLTKSVAEHMLLAQRDTTPLAIVRPALVECATAEPMPGWVDRVTGMGSFVKYIGKGVLRVSPGNPDYACELVPLDYVVNCILATIPDIVAKNCSEVYNISSSSLSRTTQKDALHCLEFYEKFPSRGVIGGPPSIEIVDAKDYEARFKEIYSAKELSHPRTTGTARHINYLFRNVSGGELLFDSAKIVEARDKLSAEERDTFDMDLTKVDWRTFYHKMAYGLARFVSNVEITESALIIG